MLALEIIEGAESRESLLEDSTNGVGHHLLRQVAHGLARSNDEGATLRLLPSAEDLQQGRLACAIHAHETNTVVITNIKGDVVEEVGTGELYRKVVDANHNK